MVLRKLHLFIKLAFHIQIKECYWGYFFAIGFCFSTTTQFGAYTLTGKICLCRMFALVNFFHERIIKWTRHIGFLTLACMARVVEGIMGTILKKGSKNSAFIALWRNLIIVYIFIFISVNETNTFMCYIMT